MSVYNEVQILNSKYISNKNNSDRKKTDIS